ncbi:hypothetical protein [uncultured Microbulbifer sp.]|uniref:DUF4886 domain-containing protein n=1 Tax=uncultured Microbulbifer sp. TaxID=348147 RepID=UPI002609AF22|nr:hypothetical protein [uncultured Microbulbifer sp.]
MRKLKNHMKAQIFLFIILSIVGGYFLAASKKQIDQGSKKDLSILFIGNSYTRPLPEVIQSIAENNNLKITYRSITPGGWTLHKHSKSEESLKAIHERTWDYVVLQEQSQLPSFSEEQRREDIYPYAIKLVNEIRETGAIPLLFLTWGRKYGDIQNIPDDTRSKMQARLLEGYQNIALSTSSEIIPVGLAWEEITSTDKAIDLYDPDGSHPNQNGVYLSAAIFVSHLLKSPQLNAPPIGNIPKETAEFLAQQANTLKYNP